MNHLFMIAEIKMIREYRLQNLSHSQVIACDKFEQIYPPTNAKANNKLKNIQFPISPSNNRSTELKINAIRIEQTIIKAFLRGIFKNIVACD